MNDREEKLLEALAWMCQQYLGTTKNDALDHECISAGEIALAVLEEHGLVEITSVRGGKWTEAGLEFLHRT